MAYFKALSQYDPQISVSAEISTKQEGKGQNHLFRETVSLQQCILCHQFPTLKPQISVHEISKVASEFIL